MCPRNALLMLAVALLETNFRSSSIADRAAKAEARQQYQDEPREVQLNNLRWQLKQVRASLAELTNSCNLQDGNDISASCPHSFLGAQELRRQLFAQEQQLRLDIAVALQQLNLLRPDGGSRLPEAEEHYRAVIATLDSELQSPLLRSWEGPGSPPSLDPDYHQEKKRRNLDLDLEVDPELRRLLLMRLLLVGNLGALLLEADRPQQALVELEAGLREAESLLPPSAGGGGISGGGDGVTAPPVSSPAGGLLCALRFNRGKALAAVGCTAASEAAYASTALGALRLDPNCFAKACAAMSRLPDDLLPFVQSAVQLAEESGLRQRLLTGVPIPATIATTTTGGGDGFVAGNSGPFVDRSRDGWLADIGVSELGWLYFALARSLDDRGRGPEEVWRVLEQANSLISSQQPYNPETDWRQLHTVMEVFNGALMRQLAAVSSSSSAAADGRGQGQWGGESAVFVVGLPRSGSTLVETMLSRYPGVWAAGEDTALAPLTPRVNELLMDQGLSNPAALADFGRRYVEDMRRRAMAACRDPHNPPVRIVDKMLRNLWLIGYIEMLLPRACIVHVVRHPLDVAISCYSQPFGYSGVPWSWRLDHIGEQVRMAAALGRHWRKVLHAGRLLTLHYEQVVAFPEVSARQLLSHCGLNWDARVLDFHTANRTVATASVVQVRKPLYNTSVGRWRKYEKQLTALAAQIQPEISSYEADLAAALRAAEAEHRRLQRQQQQQQQQQPQDSSQVLQVSDQAIAEQGGFMAVSESRKDVVAVRSRGDDDEL